MTSIQAEIIENIPESISDNEVLVLLKEYDINRDYVNLIKEYTGVKDDLLSDWLNISVKTFRSYRKEEISLKENIKEHLLLLISLFKHGVEIFGTPALFFKWLDSHNYYFEGDQPSLFLKTVSGIRFVDSHVTAIEYGDNA